MNKMQKKIVEKKIKSQKIDRMSKRTSKLIDNKSSNKVMYLFPFNRYTGYLSVQLPESKYSQHYFLYSHSDTHQTWPLPVH